MLKRIIPTLVGLAALSAVSTASAYASTVNIAVDTSTDYVDFYDSVTLIGTGGGTLSFSGVPGDDWSGDQASAFAAALAAFSLPSSTSLADIMDTPLASYSDFNETVDAGGAIYNVDYIGDPDNYLTWVAIGANDVNVHVQQFTTIFTPHALTAAIEPAVPDVPLPAGAIFFATGLGFAALRRRQNKAGKVSPPAQLGLG